MLQIRVHDNPNVPTFSYFLRKLGKSYFTYKLLMYHIANLSLRQHKCPKFCNFKKNLKCDISHKLSRCFDVPYCNFQFTTTPKNFKFYQKNFKCDISHKLSKHFDEPYRKFELTHSTPGPVKIVCSKLLFLKNFKLNLWKNA